MVKFMQSIKGKMIITISILILLIVGGTAITLYKQSVSIMEKSIVTNAKNSAKQNSATIAEWLSGMEVFIKNLTVNDNIQSMLWRYQQEPYLKRVENPNIDKFMIADLNGKANLTDGSTADISGEPYFKLVLEKQEIVFSDIMKDQTTGKNIFIIAAPIIDSRNDELKGVLSAVVSITYLQNLVADMKINGEGYGWIINQNKNTIAYPQTEYLANSKLANANEQLSKITDQMIAGKNGVSQYNYQGIENFIAYDSIGISNWSIAMVAQENKVMSYLFNLKNSSLIIVAAALILGIIIAVIIASYLANPLDYVSEVAAQIAAGDFRVEIKDKYQKRQDEVGKLANSFKEMIANLKIMILDVKNISEKVAASSEELSASGNQVGETAQEVSKAIQEVASNTEEQSAQVEETTATITELDKQIKMITTSSEAMDRQSNDVMTNIAKGNQSIEQSAQEIGKVKTNALQAGKAIESLADSSNRIGEIVSLIKDISSQTNLLALNAAIEAARAGEAGRGFSVVADEIRELAEQSNKATDEIADLITGIQTDIGSSVENMQETGQVVESSVNSIEASGTAFTEIENAAQILGNIIENINNKAQEMNVTSGEVETAVKQIAAASETAAANSEEVAASSQEQNAATDEIITAARELAEMAERLAESTAQFKLN
ncbi:methyl-accepting chemotaxis protein [Halanaerobium salsuginis]|uniref:Methyl-accepting chemotaxis sensory transducer with Cache sensor n=1 Tax=Halanaerobium salsuginis TaxID=29563 RepID=A0A1I4HX51_9FIRM|nr:methyl-accepting chemotaxis protein [Halanaerobium salsuginis]SFL46772.1 methyl-accepting chemotaxis sensory transducer with Cache sensor [Halanaerobium salsuginis]